MPPTARSEALRHAIAAERTRSARRINVARLLAISAGLLVELALWRWREAYISVSWLVFGAWWTLSAVVLLLGLRSDRLARATTMAVPLIDMPLAFLLIAQLVLRLREAGFGDDGTVVATFAGSLFALLLFVPTGMLDRWQAVLVALVAMTLQVMMALVGHVDVSVGCFTVLGLGFVAVLSAVVGGRVTGLVRSAVGRHPPSERRHAGRLRLGGDRRGARAGPADGDLRAKHRLAGAS